MIGRGLAGGGYQVAPPGMERGLPPQGPFAPGFGLGVLIVGIALLALTVIAFWQLYKKAGYEGGMGLLMLIPLVNIGAMLFLAFSDWPVLEKLREARRETTPTPNEPESPDDDTPSEPTS